MVKVVEELVKLGYHLDGVVYQQTLEKVGLVLLEFKQVLEDVMGLQVL